MAAPTVAACCEASGSAAGGSSTRSDDHRRLIARRGNQHRINSMSACLDAVGTRAAQMAEGRHRRALPLASPTAASGRLSDGAPTWWPMPVWADSAAKSFDARYSTQLKRAVRLHGAVQQQEGAVEVAVGFDRTVRRLRNMRLVLNPPLEGQRRIVVRAPPPKAEDLGWRLETSIWAPRAKWCAARMHMHVLAQTP